MTKIEELFEEIRDLDKLDLCSLSEAFCKLSEEFGELAQGVCMTLGRKNTDLSDYDIRENIKEEVVDLIMNTFLVAQRYDITLVEIEETMSKKNKKWRSKIPLRQAKRIKKDIQN